MRLSHILASTATIAAVASGEVLQLHRRDGGPNPAPITGTKCSLIYDVEVQLGNQAFILLVDTRSSDTWVVRNGYHLCTGGCLSKT